MSKHLNTDQISEWVTGEHNPTAEKHLGECEACRSQVESLQETLAGFRSSVRGWSAAQYAASQHTAFRAESLSRPLYPALYWAAAMAAAVCALLVILVFHEGSPRHVLINQTHSATTDAALMRQVDTEVSQTVPDAMEPLMKLVSWDGSPGAGEDTANKPAAEEEE